MQCVWPDVIGGIRAADDGDGAKLPGATAAEGDVNRVWSGGCGRVSTDTPPEPAYLGPGGPGGTPPPLPPPGKAQFTRYMYLNVYGGYGAWWRGAWEGLQIGLTSGFTLRTVTRGTQ